MNGAGQLELQSVRFGHEPGGWELRIPSLTLGGEGICGIAGPNGSGKSTLLELAAGLRRPDSGAVRLDGRALAGMGRKAVARRLGYLPQECPALFDYTVEQVAAMGRHAHGGSLTPDAPGDIAAVSRALDAVRMESFRRRRLSQLSGGERRRAWLASALAQEPGLLLLDEPTQALDLHHAASVMEALARQAAEGLRIVVALHDLNLAALYCDRLILLQDGQVAADAPPDEVLASGRLEALFGCHVEVVRHPDTQKPLILAKK